MPATRKKNSNAKTPRKDDVDKFPAPEQKDPDVQEAVESVDKETKLGTELVNNNATVNSPYSKFSPSAQYLASMVSTPVLYCTSL